MQNNQVMSHKELMKCLNEVSFAINDMQLYLDTHPQDQKALEDMRIFQERRKKYLEMHARYYGPLTMDSMVDGCNDSWAWILTPWPWEMPKGGC